MVLSPLEGLSPADFRAAETPAPYTAAPPALDPALLEKVLAEVLAAMPGATPARLTEVTQQVYNNNFSPRVTRCIP